MNPDPNTTKATMHLNGGASVSFYLQKDYLDGSITLMMALNDEPDEDLHLNVLGFKPDGSVIAYGGGTNYVFRCTEAGTILPTLDE